MFWFFLGKSALKKSPSAKMVGWIMLAIPLLFMMLFSLVSVGCVASIASPAAAVVQKVGSLLKTQTLSGVAAEAERRNKK